MFAPFCSDRPVHKMLNAGCRCSVGTVPKNASQVSSVYVPRQEMPIDRRLQQFLQQQQQQQHGVRHKKLDQRKPLDTQREQQPSSRVVLGSNPWGSSYTQSLPSLSTSVSPADDFASAVKHMYQTQRDDIMDEHNSASRDLTATKSRNISIPLILGTAKTTVQQKAVASTASRGLQQCLFEDDDDDDDDDVVVLSTVPPGRGGNGRSSARGGTADDNENRKRFRAQVGDEQQPSLESLLTSSDDDDNDLPNFPPGAFLPPEMPLTCSAIDTLRTMPSMSPPFEPEVHYPHRSPQRSTPPAQSHTPRASAGGTAQQFEGEAASTGTSQKTTSPKASEKASPRCLGKIMHSEHLREGATDAHKYPRRRVASQSVDGVAPSVQRHQCSRVDKAMEGLPPLAQLHTARQKPSLKKERQQQHQQQGVSVAPLITSASDHAEKSMMTGAVATYGCGSAVASGALATLGVVEPLKARRRSTAPRKPYRCK